jgi:2-keto-4-pentenoate hydratase/2-oxohepta-3-ene-1,7-dioic acid hydratase in catechol pathway
MKLVTFTSVSGAPIVGVLTEDEQHIVALNAAHLARTNKPSRAFASMRALIGGGPTALQEVRNALSFGERERSPQFVLGADAVKLCAPLPDPVMLRCCSVFRGHHVNCRRTMAAWATGRRPEPKEIELPEIVERVPGWYKGNHMSLIGPGEDIVWPAYGDRLDFELELALVAGRDGVDIAPSAFSDYVFGWSIFNDVSARDPQLAEMTLGAGPSKGKDFDTGNVMGPCIITADAFDASKARAVARVNGEVWGESDASDMIHAWPDILAYRSEGERVFAGEIITSGAFTTCSGIEQDRYLTPGDLIELEVEGIGVLRNHIVRRAA